MSAPPAIDGHQHFWSLARGDYDWLGPDLAPLLRDFGPDELAPLLRAGGLQRTVLVQAAPTEAETRFLLGIAKATPWVAAVVGWTDFEARDAPEAIAALARDPKLRGLRPMIQDIPDPDWMLGPALAPAWRALVACDLTFDALVRPEHLPNLLRLLARHPDLRVVLDHGAKPAIRAGRFEPWAAEVARLARETRACCKLSGLVTEAGPDWTPEQLRPWVEHLLACFGPERLLWGSDWPVLLLATDYPRWLQTARELLAPLGAAERAAVFGGTAARCYGIVEDPT